MIWIALALMLAQLTEAPEAPTQIDDVELAMRSWQDCTLREAEPMAERTAEMADTVAGAAMAFCVDEERGIVAAARQYLQEQYDNPDNARELVDVYKGMWKPRLVAAIVKLRAQSSPSENK